MRYSLLIILLALGNQIAAQFESEVLFETDSSVYLLLTEPTSWLVAESRAQELGGWLVTLHNEDENTAVFEAFQASESTEIEEGYFMGLRQDESLPGFYEPQGGWVWGASQGAVLWSNWDINEPNQGGNTGVENCGSVKGLNSGLGVWNDVSCSNNINKAVVEVPVFVVGCTAPPACNYDPSATFEDGSCDYASCHCLEGTVWNEELGGCVVANPSDSDFDGCVGMTDLLGLLSVFGTCNEIPWSCGDPLEYQGYDYETVQIGVQCWFAENLRAENYRNGDAIPTVLNLDDWIELSSGAQTSYSNDENLVQYHGLLYNWFAVMDPRRICPTGWHEPSNVDWVEIETHLGLDGALVDVEGWRGSVGFQLKNDETSEVSWNGSNEAGFNGTPSGYRQLSGGSSGFVGLGSRGEYWTTSNATSDASNKISRSLDTDQEALGLSPNSPNCGFSVRCIRDSE